MLPPQRRHVDSEYPRFQEICAEIGWASLDANLLDVTLALVPGVTHRLEAGIDVADVGCGAGHAINLMAGAFPASRFIGWDVSETGLAAGRAEAERRQLANVTFERIDAAELDQPERFDFITTFDAVHDQARPDLVLRAIAAALRPGGSYLCVEVGASSTLAENLDIPWAPALYAASCMHCLCVSGQSGGRPWAPCGGEQEGSPNARRGRVRFARNETVRARPGQQLLHSKQDGRVRDRGRSKAW